MNIMMVLAILVLCSGAANLLHWLGRASEKIFYYPTSGWLRAVFNIWMLATYALSFLFLAGFVQDNAFLYVLIGMPIATAIYSIWIRQAQQRQAASSAYSP